jgi:hypothetical protein
MLSNSYGVFCHPATGDGSINRLAACFGAPIANKAAFAKGRSRLHRAAPAGTADLNLNRKQTAHLSFDH